MENESFLKASSVLKDLEKYMRDQRNAVHLELSA